MRILIVDDHVLLADMIRMVFEARGDVVDVAADGSHALECVHRCKPDVALIDVMLQGESGLIVGAKVKEGSPETKLIAVTGAVDGRIVREAVEMGFHGFIGKGSPLSQLVKTVDIVVQGQAVIPQRLARSFAGHRSPAERDASLLADQLSARERAVLDLLVAGANSAQIQTTLGVSGNTVRSYVQSILTKLQVHSRLEAAAFAIRNNLVEQGAFRSTPADA